MSEQNETHEPTDPSWFEKKSNLRLMIIGLIVCCVLLLLAQLTYTNDHAHFPQYENIFGFEAMFGFVAFVVIVFLGMGLRRIIERDEDYYDG